ncbi:nitrilase family protein [Curtobacterium sp. BRB10]|uniref:nitrilase family protein n=1 Tax=Curtobacterium sp. BRB10 TaxID=2962579 RepID=UPI0028818FF7|nr:nitrilase family protein [Curtobacterium sp. BRB10]MDT0235316.1 nitrilase family protein [Curtobacterium sp. BRB10]
MRVSTIQFEPIDGDVDANLKFIEQNVYAAVRSGADFVAFPEMCILGYWHLTMRERDELLELSEPADGPSVSRILDLAVRANVGVGVGFLERHGDDLFNSYAVCLPDGTAHVHRKIHAFEHEAISSGDRYTVFDTPWGVRMGVLICWDNNLVENVRITALLGADVLVAPHQTGGTDSRSPYGMKKIPVELWRNRHSDPKSMRDAIRGANGREWILRWLPSRAHDNGLFVVFSNGIGEDGGEIRTGNSMIIDPYGRIVAETDAAGAAIVTATLDLELLDMSTGRRWIAGRKPALYAPLIVSSGRERDARTARFSEVPVSRPSFEPTDPPVSM